jgi:N-formylglutamate deformylase
MTDAWTDEIVARIAFDATRVIFPVSRLVVDPERFPDDADEPMAARGIGDRAKIQQNDHPGSVMTA